MAWRDRQTNIQTQTGRQTWTDIKTDRNTDIQVKEWMDKQKYGQSEGQTFRKMKRQKDEA